MIVQTPSKDVFDRIFPFSARVELSAHPPKKTDREIRDVQVQEGKLHQALMKPKDAPPPEGW